MIIYKLHDTGAFANKKGKSNYYLSIEGALSGFYERHPEIIISKTKWNKAKTKLTLYEEDKGSFFCWDTIIKLEVNEY